MFNFNTDLLRLDVILIGQCRNSNKPIISFTDQHYTPMHTFKQHQNPLHPLSKDMMLTFLFN